MRSSIKYMNSVRLLLSGSICALVVSAAQAYAAEEQPAGVSGGVEEIIVTAQRRSENLQNTPIAITAMTASSLEAQGITNLPGIVQATPSLYFAPYPSSATTLSLFMRGQGIGDANVTTKDGGIGLYVDGIYQSRPQVSTFDLADVERVEVLRGPQGALYGRNTTGGAINIITSKPTGEFGVKGLTSVGNLAYRRVLLNVNLPEVQNVKVKLTGLYSNRDGWAKNSESSDESWANDFHSDHKLAARAAVRWEPSSDVTVDYSVDYSHLRTTPQRYVNESPAMPLLYDGYSPNTDSTYRTVYLPYSHAKSFGHSLIAEYAPSDNLTLRSLSGYRHIKTRNFQDYTEAFMVPYYSYDRLDAKTWTQEFQAIGAVSDQIKYVFGAYYFKEKSLQYLWSDAVRGPALYMSNRIVAARSISKAVYGQVTWTPEFADEKLDFTIGARSTWDSRSAERWQETIKFSGDVSPLVYRGFNGAGTETSFGQSVGNTKVKNKKFNPSFTVTYRPTENITTYAKVVTGYKAGGAHPGAPSFKRTFGPESVTSYEGGIKADLFDRRLRLNLAAYSAKYKDLQVDISVDPINPSTVETFNAGQATVKGLEADVTLVVTDGLTLQANYSYTKSKVKKVMAPADTIFDPDLNASSPVDVGDDVSGYFALPFTPKHAVRISGDWQIGEIGPGTLSLHADYTWKDKVFTTGGAGPSVPVGAEYAVNPSYDLLDARLSYKVDRGSGRSVEVSLWGKNVLDNKYPGFNIGFGSVLTGYGAQAISYGAPATYGVDIGFTF